MGKDLMRSRTFHGTCDAVSPIMAFIERASRAARYCGLLPCKTCGPRSAPSLAAVDDMTN